MNTEWQAEIERRAALHAVLADPGRLAVVELLALGDRSPSELSAELGMPSNLVAHHVGVLLEHGLVTPTAVRGRPSPDLRPPGTRRGRRAGGLD